MDVSTITMDPAEAERRLKEYRRHKHHGADAEYQAAAVAYEQLAKGTPLLLLSDAIAGAPLDAKGRPRLAIARADRRQVMLQPHPAWTMRGRILFNALDPATVGEWDRFPQLAIDAPLPSQAELSPHSNMRGFALVPMVPPAVLGNRGRNTHFVLWEVEAWADVRIGAKPDIDPYLLRYVAPDLYAVVGEWELTDVERAVMRGRRD